MSLAAEDLIVLIEEYKGGVKPKFTFEDIQTLVSHIRYLESEIERKDDLRDGYVEEGYGL